MAAKDKTSSKARAPAGRTPRDQQAAAPANEAAARRPAPRRLAPTRSYLERLRARLRKKFH